MTLSATAVGMPGRVARQTRALPPRPNTSSSDHGPTDVRAAEADTRRLSPTALTSVANTAVHDSGGTVNGVERSTLYMASSRAKRFQRWQAPTVRSAEKP